MIWLLTRPIVWPMRTARFGVATGYRTGRLLGYRRLTVLFVGIAIGLLVAPFPGKDLRAILMAKLFPTEPDLRPPADQPIDLTAQGV